MIAGLGIGINLQNMFGMAIMGGMTGALSTLGSNAAGAKKF